MATGLPEKSVDRVLDFIDDIWNGIETLILALLEMLWNLFVGVFFDLGPALVFSLLICIYLYFFNIKFIEDPR